MNILGLDIGTTTICAAVIDSLSGTVTESVTVPNNSLISSDKPFERLEDPKMIVEKCLELVAAMCEKYAPVSCIGITGQMHGVLYLDKNGDALSPLWFWQDESGNEIYKSGLSFACCLSEITGYHMASGFGLTTVFCHLIQGIMPKNAAKICTIHDFVAMKLTGRREPLMHTSDAASFGLFDSDTLDFDTEAVKKAGIPVPLLPEVTDKLVTVGSYGSIPVCVAIGDNQASFIGSVSDMDAEILVNIGTGSQISFLTADRKAVRGTELRPLCDGKFIRVGSSLCGGRAFAMLEKFLRASAELVTGEKIKSAYPAIDAFLASNPELQNRLEVSTRFAGTREDPNERGYIMNLGTENFTPGHLIAGIMDGIAEELFTMYSASYDSGRGVLVGSGNGLRKNKALCELFSKRFGMTLHVPAHMEEAAFGAALCSMTAAGFSPSLAHAQKLIKYL